MRNEGRQGRSDQTTRSKMTKDRAEPLKKRTQEKQDQQKHDTDDTF